jgi:hypothetical protein
MLLLHCVMPLSTFIIIIGLYCSSAFAADTAPLQLPIPGLTMVDYTLGDLLKCVNGTMPIFYIDEGHGHMTLYTYDHQTQLDNDVDAIVLGCVEKLGSASLLTSQVLPANSPRPEGSEILGSQHAKIRPYSRLSRSSLTYSTLKRQYGNFLTIPHRGTSCQENMNVDNTQFLIYTQCKNPPKPISTLGSVLFYTYSCCSIYAKRYFHHFCHLKRGIGATSYPKVNYVPGNSDNCFEGSILSYCNTQSRGDACHV